MARFESKTKPEDPAVTGAIDKLRFNVAIAHIYELANVLSAGLNTAGETPAPDMRFALREAAAASV